MAFIADQGGQLPGSASIVEIDWGDGGKIEDRWFSVGFISGQNGRIVWYNCRSLLVRLFGFELFVYYGAGVLGY